MTDTDTDDANGGRTDATTDDPTSEPETAVGRSTDGGATATCEPESRSLVTYVEWAAFAILCLLALVATFRFYFAVSEAIRVWFSPDFVPVFQAVFNLLVLVASALGISVLVRRIA
ncbi:hypothetical protein [Halosimplex sp. TS25]|uniref:hypothetical protein n=1 Tax=Halosimplex rarum TaxID=3396619 RepID=UPI0039EB783A